MGYDIYMVDKPEGEDEEVARLGKLFAEACEVRDALPDSERGTWGAGGLGRHLEAGGSLFDLPPGSSRRYEAAKREVDRLHELMSDARRSYFRWNVFGMSSANAAMLDLGMVYSHPAEPWPKRPESTGAQVAGGALEDDSLYLKDEGGGDGELIVRGERSALEWARMYADRYYTGVTVTEGDLKEAEAFRAACDAHRRAHPPGGTTIPLGKFGTNDGWLVTPAEALEALSAYYARSEAERGVILARHGFNERGRDYWQEWINFIDLSTKHGGFEVH